MSEFEPVIGLEVHLALSTKSKMFCGCPAETFGSAPNTHTCPVCLGLPGSLPTINRAAFDKALMFALALGCSVPERTQFHRKNYFYPDAPKNYQISQYDHPVGEHGFIELGGRRVGVTRCHVEEDAGRSQHPLYAPYSLVDLNRAGAPLLEMVTEPDLRTPEEAREFLNKVRAIARALGVSDANPEEGKLRADVNVSVRRPGAPFGTKVEVKNLNSFRSVQRALEFEIKRQSRILADSGSVRQDTLGWDEGGQKTYLMRTKEGEADYRYFPDPDLPPVRIDAAWLERLRADTPELPDAKEARYVGLGVRADTAALLAYDTELSSFFDRTLKTSGGNAQAVANWLGGDVTGYLNANGLTLETSKLTPEHLARLVDLVERGTISGKVAKELLPDVIGGASPEALVRVRGLEQVTDASALGSVVDAVLAENPKLVDEAKANPKAVNALLGRVIKSTGGKAKPELVRELIVQKLG
ncbi:MAG: Aspartyl-tRNA(Asn) amidotransferase subunit B @ Glutamyl-tRNA(Gln) amidotransferase subunit B [uncultured Truepera sp.]|uniref:Aspartyl/glutamyl-tRNA(Asn/Gln) amidotransferase subunit B n=1 Tax=uncultured Truepera sp. TaxID=543023 RepID=A0A6J4VLX6_9DEIN|nr:MAG: Aspartyl-tRNA(Asn) amidotransferase subunit B @ Glutamyl-tRNA(Gln) amidotransferase subunit B [uncultured Truepera sp.]